MNGSSLKLPRFLLPLGSLVFCVSLMATPRHQDTQRPAPDSTKTNKDQTPPTSDQQKMNPEDQDGKVTLRGPVRSEDEKSNLEAKAVAVAGQENVTNQLEVAPSK
jgi:osmotically-inducible protein OsmY